MHIYRFSWSRDCNINHNIFAILRFLDCTYLLAFSYSLIRLSMTRSSNWVSYRQLLWLACFMLCDASVQSTWRHHSLQLCVYIIFLSSTVALVILSELQLNWISDKEENKQCALMTLTSFNRQSCCNCD